jgi:hypothetical protein
MIRKVALVQALREAFPEDFGGLYSPEEMGNQAAVVLDDAAQPVEVPAETPKETPKAEAEEIPFA